MKIGDLVMLVNTDGLFMPPLGSIGEVVSNIDAVGDLDVWFHKTPCPVGCEISWVCHKSWLVVINPDDEHISIPKPALQDVPTDKE